MQVQCPHCQQTNNVAGHYPPKPAELSANGVERVEFEQVLGEESPPGAPAGNRNAAKEEAEKTIPDNVRDCSRDRSNEPPAGNSEGYAIRRLSRERPDLLERVKAGELSAHGAGLQRPCPPAARRRSQPAHGAFSSPNAPTGL